MLLHNMSPVPGKTGADASDVRGLWARGPPTGVGRMLQRHLRDRLTAGVLILIFAGAVGLFMNGQAGSAQTAGQTASYGPLVTAALKYVGQYKGQCRAFVQEVTREAMRRVIWHSLPAGLYRSRRDGGTARAGE